MPRRKKTRRPTQSTYRGPRFVVPVDSTKKRQQEKRLYERRCRELDKVTGQVRSFEDVDVPAFALWVETEFADEIKQCRAGSAALAELAELVDAVRHYAQVKRISQRVAYAEVKAAREAGADLFTDTQDDTSDESDDEHQDDESFDAFEKAVNEFFEFLTGESAEDASDVGGDADGSGPFSRGNSRHQTPHRFQMSGQDQTSEEYLKSLYRKLVRILHPDTNDNQTPEEQALWHEVQEAYSWRDIQRLERLLQSVERGGKTSLDLAAIPISHIMDLRRDVERRLRILKSKLTHARREIAWSFSDVKLDARRLGGLRRRIATDLASDLATISSERKRLERQIAVWERPPPQRSPGVTRSKLKPRRQRPDDVPYKSDWPFGD